MKALKISLAVIVIAAIAFFLQQSGVFDNFTGKKILPPENQFRQRIEQKIDSLSKWPDSTFCKNFYKEIAYLIDDYYKNNRLGYDPGTKTYDSLANEQWKINYTSDLYSAYADKFILQALYVFRGSDWKIEDLDFIRSEYQILQNPEWLQQGGQVDKKLTEIQTVFSQYDEIENFIAACRHFSYLGAALSDRFPIPEVQTRMSQAKTYQTGQGYVKNCNRLQEELKGIPQALFNAHVRYFDNKIRAWSNKFSYFNSYTDYDDNLYRHLKNEIETWNNNIYQVANFNNEKQRLLRRWSDDDTRAKNYKY